MFDINHLMKIPEDESVKIWRYMSLKKFESLLKEQALYFCNSKSFKDNHEGSYCRKNLHTEVYMDGLRITQISIEYKTRFTERMSILIAGI